MSDFEYDDNTETETGEGIAVYTDEVVQDLAGIIIGMSDDHDGEAVVSSDTGKLAKAYMEVWLNELVENSEEMLRDKTTVGELLLFVAIVQAELDLGQQGGRLI